MRRISVVVLTVLGLVIPASSMRADEAKVDLSKLPPAASGKVDFQNDIAPIFAKSCVACHGPDKQRGGLRLDQGEAAMKGGNTGAVILRGKAVQSRLLHVVAGLDPEVAMPPGERPRLTAIEIGKLRAWIDQGADWPKTVSGPKTAASKHWSFQPIQRPTPPKVENAAWVRNPIDAFILARLEKEKVAPSSEADRTTLIRRLSFDLLGLPPTLQEVDAFLKDASPDAYEKLVDRLLASPHYGERWGRHWLDLARYADSDGYETDRPRPFAWRYRQWVIDALNQDMPFDRFTIEQFAGDLLPNATLAQKTATGFHRNTLTNLEGGTDKEQFRVEACVDRVNTTAKVWLGLTLNCTQCHDHKYDPFSQREFYQLFAFFNSDNEVNLPAHLPGEEEVYNKNKAAFDQKKKELQESIAELKKGLKPEQVKTDKTDGLGNPSYKMLAELNKKLAEHEKTAPVLSIVPALELGAGRKTHVLIRGDFLRPGIAVESGMPGVLHPFTKGGKLTRLDLGHWLVDPANPLTARVLSNWVWHRYFGRGLVATLEDFGVQGERPSHPELLDFLATEFVSPSPRGGEGKGKRWSMKELHKLIVTSATYRQSSKTRPELAGRDQNNVCLARQNRWRLEAEIIRDNALAVSGLLNRTIGGPSVKPPQPDGISELTYANNVRWVESKGADRYRRGMYTWFQRTSPYPMLMTFDAPDGVLACVRRERSNTPLAALFLLNERPFVECAQALAKRIVADKPGTLEERLEHAFRLCVARQPRENEKKLLRKAYDHLLAEARANPKESARLVPDPMPGLQAGEAAAWVALGRLLLNLDEFIARE